MIRTLTCALGIGLLLGAAAHAQTDHLECFKVKDSERKATFRAQVNGLAPHGCKIKLPAKVMCVPTLRPEMSPSPGASPAGQNAGAFLCYQLRCRKNAVAPLSVSDEFGRRLVRPRRSRLLCAPLPENSEGSQTDQTTTTTLCDCGAGSSSTSTTLGGGGATTTTVHKPATTSTTHTTSTASTSTSTSIKGSTTTTLPGAPCDTVSTSCGSCGNGACQPLRPSGQLICAFQTQAFCSGSCQSTADCAAGRWCVGTSGDAGTCCTPCE